MAWRSANYPVSDDGHNSYADLTSIPQVNVERIEVLKDGASAPADHLALEFERVHGGWLGVARAV
ncbi:hypothetical protein [Sphingomonas sp. LHG3443-2]|uniref:hypothetical protein n=1 Tax=Sphingomonas sp. LHG3443-2 TaxID=2804639 RepID=UPI003CEB880F